MNLIQNQTFDEERALYGSTGLHAANCRFDGPADGESAFKECRDIQVTDSFFNLRYPFWHDEGLRISGCELTPLCRAALWYSENVEIADSALHGIKALRECGNVTMTRCDVLSAEFGWSTRGMTMTDCTVQGEYFMMRSDHLHFDNVRLQGKYSFQYIQDSLFENCILDTKDAFWHARNVTVRNSVVKGEYLAWYCENVTFENCKIIGTQPLCYCKGLRLIHCEMVDTDLCFEKSQVEATLTSHVLSIKNPLSGYILAPSVGQEIRDDPHSQGVLLLQGTDSENALRLLTAGSYTCVLCRGSQVITSLRRGVAPLVKLLDQEVCVAGFTAADKVVGKATAWLYCLLGVERVYGQVMSRGALEVLQRQGVQAEYGQLTDHIINRAGDGICPFEQAVADAPNAETALRAIRAQMDRMQIVP